MQIGNYMQNNSTYKSPITWAVLAKEDNKILLITDKAIECKQYSESKNKSTWDESSIRTWLNDTFLNEAFTPDEQDKILTTYVSADENPEFDVYQGASTQDKIFILSINEAEKYFNSPKERLCEPTDYVLTKKPYISNEDGVNFCSWWLRTHGKFDSSSTYVSSTGYTYEPGDGVNADQYGIRPAMWISCT